jgi:hypothetical protein
MAISTYSIDEVPGDIWTGFSKSGPAGVFYKPRLLRIWEEAYDWQSFVYVSEDSGFVGFIKSTIAGKMLFSLPFGWYGGFVGAAPSKSFVTDVMRNLTQSGFIQQNVVQFGGASDESVYRGYQRRTLTTHLLDLGENDAFSENTRRNLNRAEANDLHMRPLIQSDSEDVMTLLDEHEKLTGKRRKMVSGFYEKLLEVSAGLPDEVRLAGAWSGDRLVACHIYFETETDVFYFDGVSNESGRELLANFRLFADTIDGARRRGVRRLNFGATPEGDEGLVRFKESWGAKSVTYSEYSRVSAIGRVIDKVRRRR